MKQVVQSFKGEIQVLTVPTPVVRPAGVLVANRCSLVSAGTERTSLESGQRSLIQKAMARPEQVLQLAKLVHKQGLDAVRRAVAEKFADVSPLGYSSAGVIVEVGEGIGDLQPGDRVACAGAGYANHAEYVFVPRNLCVPLPKSVSMEEAAFGTVGAIALQAVRQAEVGLRDRTLVIGLGLVGQIVAQLLKLAGCFVAGTDLESRRIEIAQSLGLDLGITSVEKNFGGVRDKLGNGFDRIIITAATMSNAPIETAIDLARDRGQIVVVGKVGLDLPYEAAYRKELDIRFSRSYGPGRYDPIYEEHSIDYPYGYIRWTENRNIEAFIELVSLGKLKLEPLISHRFKVDDAGAAYESLLGKSEQSETQPLAVLLEYPGEVQHELKKPSGSVQVRAPSRERKEGKIQIGLIGAGLHVRELLLPILCKIDQAEIRTLASASGLSSRRLANLYGIPFCAADYRGILDDKAIDAAVIASRHDTHAVMTRDAIEVGKDVFVEKPLAITLEELELLFPLYQVPNPRITVGFNRRFSPFGQKVKEWFDGAGPLQILYRVNAGHLPRDHWLHDPVIGGGRVVGEVCHFVDFCQFLVGSSIHQVSASAVSTPGLTLPEDVHVTLIFQNGSSGSIVYSGRGATSLPKERFEVFGGNQMAICDDFQELVLGDGGRVKKEKTRVQDKGHRGLLKAFVESVVDGSDMPIPFAEAFESTLATFCILGSFRGGSPKHPSKVLAEMGQSTNSFKNIFESHSGL